MGAVLVGMCGLQAIYILTHKCLFCDMCEISVWCGGGASGCAWVRPTSDLSLSIWTRMHSLCGRVACRHVEAPVFFVS